MCCLFGLIDYKDTLTGGQKSRMISILATNAEVRGTDATGIAYNRNGTLCIYKQPIPAHKMRFHIAGSSKVVMGHTRLATQGSQKYLPNNHPFPGHIRKKPFALAHNGVLHNDLELRISLHLPSTKIKTDSFIAVQLIERQKTLDLNSLQTMAEQVRGSFCFTVLDHQDNLYFIKGDNPLCLYHFPKTGLYLYASTEEILKTALRRMHLCETPLSIPLSPGDLLCVNINGHITRSRFDDSHLLPCLYDSWSSFWDFWDTGATEHHFLESTYINELKSMAYSFGFTPYDIDAWLADGFSFDEIEDFLYTGTCESQKRMCSEP